MTECTEPAAITYEEHLGPLGANFRIRLTDPISVEIGPLLARSSHVAYANVIEPLLRFVMASRGRMLLHSACVELDGDSGRINVGAGNSFESVQPVAQAAHAPLTLGPGRQDERQLEGLHAQRLSSRTCSCAWS